MKPIWKPLEHHLNQQLRSLPSGVKSFLLSLSGGADSTALALAFSRLRLGALRAVHFHHGDGDNVEFREQSQKFVIELCRRLEIPLELHKNPQAAPQSEERLREFRKQLLHRQLQPQEAAVLGHHQDDLLETRLMRLIRGTGQQGILAMKTWSGLEFRPWLQVSRQAIEGYLQDLGQQYLLDPSQEDLRSWLRHSWLPQLETRSPGAVASIARSLENLGEISEQLPTEIWLEGGMDHLIFQKLSVEQQRQALAQYFLRLKSRSFSRGQIEEILKHLDKSQIEHSFQLSEFEWSVNAEQIRATRRLK